MNKMMISKHVNGDVTFRIKMEGYDLIKVKSLQEIAEHIIQKNSVTAKNLRDCFDHGFSLPSDVDFSNVNPSERKELTRLIYVFMK